jgi:hypothetical protein
MMTAPHTDGFRADRASAEALADILAPLCGGIWLATDVTTHLHWVIQADHVSRVSGTLDGRSCRAFGVATVCAADGLPVFLINERDTIEWIEPGVSVAIYELGQGPCEIRLERLDDLDARTIARSSLENGSNGGERFRTIAIAEDRLLQIYDDQLPTGNAAADVAFSAIEATIDERRRLVGPTAGTIDVLDQMTADLDQTLRTRLLHSFIWAAVLREQIADMRQSLAG